MWEIFSETQTKISLRNHSGFQSRGDSIVYAPRQIVGVILCPGGQLTRFEDVWMKCGCRNNR